MPHLRPSGIGRQRRLTDKDLLGFDTELRYSRPGAIRAREIARMLLKALLKAKYGGLALLCLAVCLNAQQDQTAVQQDAALLRQVMVGTNGLVPITRKEFDAVATAWKAQPGSGSWTYAEAKTNAAVNGMVFTTVLVMVESEISGPMLQVYGRRPFTQEVLAAWLVGVRRFSRLQYDISKITDPSVLLSIERFDHRRNVSLIMMQPRSRPPMPDVPEPHQKRSQPTIP